MKLKEIGEQGLISLLTGEFRTPPGVVLGVGDDAAVLVSPDGLLLFTTDMLVEGVHFRLGHGGPEQLGYKALAVNVSDIAAMGGIPYAAVIALALPPELPVEEICAVYRGLSRAAEEFKVSLVGGDTVRSPGPLVINIALLGKAQKGMTVARSGAKPGDLVYVTGTLGAAAAGLFVLDNPGPWPAEAYRFVKESFLEPKPQVESGLALARCRVSALDDNSDGLAVEMHEICRASCTGCLIESNLLPVDGRVREIASLSGHSVLDWALHGGEDYGLIACMPPQREEETIKAFAVLGIPFTRVGSIITEKEGLHLVLPDGRITALAQGGYNHFGVDI